ncbi:hypothetical protein D3C73_1256930 [compost metagenome]
MQPVQPVGIADRPGNPGAHLIHVCLVRAQHIGEGQGIIGAGVQVEHVDGVIIGLVGLVSLHNAHTGKIILGVRQARPAEFLKILVMVNDVNQIDRDVLQAALHHLQIGVDQILIGP